MRGLARAVSGSACDLRAEGPAVLLAGCERSLDRVPKRLGRHRLVRWRRKTEAAADPEGVGAAAVRDGRHRRRNLGTEPRSVE